MSHQSKDRPHASTRSVVRDVLDRGPNRAFLLGLFVVGFVVFFPSIRTPYLLDDYLHRAMANGVFPAHRGPFDLYDFVSGRDRALLLERGILPWWTDPALEIRFFRPLSSLLLYADHRALGAYPILLHAHSFLWWMLAVLSVRGLLLRFFSPRIVLVATTVFALSPCHVLPLAWLANREALVSLTFGLTALGSYEDFRSKPSVRGALFTALLFSLALLAGEYALLMTGYVGALELFRHRESETPKRRVAGLLPFVVPVVTYLGVRRSLGYGTAASGFYSDPSRDPRLYFTDAPRRLLTLLADAWFSLDGEALRSSTPLWALVLGVMLAIAFFAKPVKTALAAQDDRAKRFGYALLLGSSVSLVPVLAVVPSPRLLGAAMVGIAAIVAIVLDHAWLSVPASEDEDNEATTDDAGSDGAPVPARKRSGHAPRGELTAAAALAIGFFHLVHAPVTAWVSARSIQKGAIRFAFYAGKLQKRIAERPDAEVIVMRGLGSAFFLPFAVTEGGAPPKRWRILAHTGHVLATRDDEHTLTLTVPEEASVFPIGHGNLFRTHDAKVSTGTVIVGQRMKAEVLSGGDDGPRKVRFTFDEPPDDAIWISETSKGFPETPVPEPGFGAPFDP